VAGSNGVKVTLNTITSMFPGGGNGVVLCHSNNSLVDRNIFSSNLYAVNVTGSQSVVISDNIAVTSNSIGVQLEDTVQSLIFNNTFANGEDGIDVLQSNNNNVTRNLIKDMKYFGILFAPDSYSVPESEFPHGNIINENTLQRNHYAGIELQNATQNTFYHNDFFANTLHVNPVADTSTTREINYPNYWDNSTQGGFAGGNYWDNYNGTDPDHDGIGTPSYPIGEGNMDVRPLMVPFLPVPVLITFIRGTPSSGTPPLSVSMSATVIGSLPPFTYEWNFGDNSPTSSSLTTGHTYTRAGVYTVTLKVRDSGGGNDSSTFSVTVANQSSPPSPVSPLILVVSLLAAVLGLIVGFLFWRQRRRRGNLKDAKPRRRN